MSTYAVVGLGCGMLSWVIPPSFLWLPVALGVLPIASIVWMVFTVIEVWLSDGKRWGTGFAIGGMLLGVVRFVTVSMGGH